MRTFISCLDIPTIAWGIACVIWPQGFLYARSVMDQESEPNKVIKERLNLTKLLWTDTSALSPWQVAHMAQRHGNTMTREALTRYRDEFTRGKGRNIKLTEELEMTLRVPNMDQYLQSGQKWINNIVTMVDNAFALPPNEGVRDQYILNQGKATNMRQFAHFVESISPGNGIIQDAETIDIIIDALTSSDEVRDNYFKGIRSFTEDSTISVVAIPATEKTDKSNLPRFPHLLPLDVLSVFFILLVQKVQQIESRA
jgi:hypothetical protein